MNNLPNVFVGVDVSKKYLDVHIFPENKSLREKNDSNCFDKLSQHFSKYRVEQIVCESSGGYEHNFFNYLNENNYKTWIVDPKRIKGFIVSEGVKAKTDKIDAKMIAKFASKTKCEYIKQNKSVEYKELKELVRRKTEVTIMVSDEKRRLKGPTTIYSKNRISKHIDFMQEEIKELNIRIDFIIDKNEEMKEKAKILESMPGIGKATSACLISHLTELGTIDSKKISSLIGVAPFNRESGSFIGVAKISGGRPIPRKALYMAALTASRSNPKLKMFYNKLIKSGKKPKVALIAVMRKMIVILNAMVKNNKMWNENYEAYIKIL